MLIMFALWSLMALICLCVGIAIVATEKKFLARWFVGFAFFAAIALSAFVA